MIRKPKADEIRENKAVTVLRESRNIAVEGGKGVGQGVAKAYTYWFVGIMGFGLVMSVVSSLSGGGFLWLLSGAVLVWVMARREGSKGASANPIVRMFSSVAGSEQDRPEAIAPRGTAPARAAFAAPAPGGRQVSQSGQFQLDIASLVRQAVTLLVPAVFLIFLSALGMGTPFMLAGIAMVGLAVLLIARLFSDRVALSYDPRSVTVTGLLGSAQLLWEDVEDVHATKFSRLNLKVLFTSGARRNLVIWANRNRLGGPTQLLVPIDLLGLEREQLTGLVTDLLCCRAAGGEVVPSWQGGAQAPAVAAAPVPIARSAPSAATGPGFDPDEIMARYLAERERLVADRRPAGDAVGSRPRGFGRKGC